MKHFFASLGRSLLTLVVLLVAVVAGWQLWSYYMLEPWTRDGRVRADVVTIAADVPGGRGRGSTSTTPPSTEE